jgi:hypothetical protein
MACEVFVQIEEQVFHASKSAINVIGDKNDYQGKPHPVWD